MIERCDRKLEVKLEMEQNNTGNSIEMLLKDIRGVKLLENRREILVL